ncbi:MAG: hypothetical protein ABIB47_01165 [Candidatus Woesearchaeota archaeon]
MVDYCALRREFDPNLIAARNVVRFLISGDLVPDNVTHQYLVEEYPLKIDEGKLGLIKKVLDAAGKLPEIGLNEPSNNQIRKCGIALFSFYHSQDRFLGGNRQDLVRLDTADTRSTQEITIDDVVNSFKNIDKLPFKGSTGKPFQGPHNPQSHPSRYRNTPGPEPEPIPEEDIPF